MKKKLFGEIYHYKWHLISLGMILLSGLLVIIIPSEKESLIFSLNEMIQLSSAIDKGDINALEHLEDVFHDFDILAAKAEKQKLTKNEYWFMNSAFRILGASQKEESVNRLLRVLGNENFIPGISGNAIIFSLARSAGVSQEKTIPALIAFADKYPQYREHVAWSFWDYANAPEAYAYVARHVNENSSARNIYRQIMYYITGDSAWARETGIISQKLLDDFIHAPIQSPKIIKTVDDDGRYPIVPWR